MTDNSNPVDDFIQRSGRIVKELIQKYNRFSFLLLIFTLCFILYRMILTLIWYCS
ncbi:MAG: hypothetical protein HYU69_00815 [Bacteroidetes bacterium]|nr:hypothetical protein [Bacteroidota bacterium]